MRHLVTHLSLALPLFCLKVGSPRNVKTIFGKATAHCHILAASIWVLINAGLNLGFAAKADCQTNISGVVNTYTTVTGTLNNCPCSIGCRKQISVGSTAGFAVGNRVLIVQMRGATLSTTNTLAGYGAVTAANSAGVYEFHTIQAIAGVNITLANPLGATFNFATGAVQLIRVPVYTGNVNVVGTVQPQDWNGATGGILAFEVLGTLTLNANIVANGNGFRGGAPNTNNGFYCSFTGLFAAASTIEGGRKGEGIGQLPTGHELARGRQANGGGGGNNTNAGGGGGGGVSAGGLGGGEWSGCNNSLGGQAGEGYTLSSTRLIMGGGGGGGHQNNVQATAGGDGGGIVLIRCLNLVGNSFTISANGLAAINAGIDGAGGGGGGGIVSIQLTGGGITGPLNLRATGGNGGVGASCHGNGGGGGGGAVAIFGATPPVTVTQSVAAGNGGSTSGCTVQQGVNGTLGSLNNAAFNPTPCPLGTSNLVFEARLTPQNHAQLVWQAESEVNLREYVIEHSLDGALFKPIATQAPKGTPALHTHIHPDPGFRHSETVFYRLRMLSLDGAESLSDIQALTSSQASHLVQLAPNPIQQGGKTFLLVHAPSASELGWQIFDNAGRQVAAAQPFAPEGFSKHELHTQHLSPGTYQLLVHVCNRQHAIKLLVMP